jgi:hypothetical protein
VLFKDASNTQSVYRNMQDQFKQIWKDA